MVGKYVYDSFGNHRVLDSNNNEIASRFAVANLNLIRYKGYYYDIESEMYYCLTRYYNPQWRRWISPDSTNYLDPESLSGLNLFVYCGNNPVIYYDPLGYSATIIGLIVGAIIGAIVGFGISAYIDYADDGQIFNGSIAWYDYFGATILGGVTGACIGDLV